MPGIVGGVVGAVLAVFGAPYVQGPPPLAPEPASRLASVETSMAAQGEQLAVLQGLADELEPTVRGAVEAAVAEVPSRDGQALAEIGERLETVAGEIAAMATAADGLEQQLQAQAERIDALGGTVATEFAAAGEETRRLLAEARAAGTAEVEAARAALGGEIAELRGVVQTSLEEIGTLKGAIDGMQQARSRAAAAALLAREIDRTIEAGNAFEEPLERLILMSGDDAEIEAALSALRPYAAAGVPTIGELRDGLAALADSAPTPAVAGSEWLGKTVENIAGLVTVRDKDSESDIATGRLAEADQALRDGDVEAAIAKVEEVAAQPDAVDPALAESWLGDARARVTAVAAQAQLDAHIRELLTATVN